MRKYWVLMQHMFNVWIEGWANVKRSCYSAHQHKNVWILVCCKHHQFNLGFLANSQSSEETPKSTWSFDRGIFLLPLPVSDDTAKDFWNFNPTIYSSWDWACNNASELGLVGIHLYKEFQEKVRALKSNLAALSLLHAHEIQQTVG